MKKRFNTKQKNIGLSIAIGILVSTLCSILSAGICATLIASETLPQNYDGLMVGAITFISSIVGAWCSVREYSEKRGIIASIFAIGYWLFLIVIGSIFGDGHIAGVGVTGLLILCASITTALLPTRNSKKFRPSKLRI